MKKKKKSWYFDTSRYISLPIAIALAATALLILVLVSAQHPDIHSMLRAMTSGAFLTDNTFEDYDGTPSNSVDDCHISHQLCVGANDTLFDNCLEDADTALEECYIESVDQAYCQSDYEHAQQVCELEYGSVESITEDDCDTYHECQCNDALANCLAAVEVTPDPTNDPFAFPATTPTVTPTEAFEPADTFTPMPTPTSTESGVSLWEWFMPGE